MARLAIPRLPLGAFKTPPSHGPKFLRLTTAGLGDNFWYVGGYSTDPSALPNKGVRTTIDVKSQPAPGALAFWVSDALSNNLWGQVGYYIYQGSTPVAFYQIWDLNKSSLLATGTASVSAGPHTFAMFLQSGTTWVFTLDGKAFGAYDTGVGVSSSTYPVYALSEQGYVSSPSPFSEVAFLTAMEILKPEGWARVESAHSYGTAWGVQGQLQNSSLLPYEMVVSSSLPPLPNGTLLWTTVGPVPGTYEVTFAESGLPDGTTYSITVDGITHTLTAPNTLTLTFQTGTTHTYAFQSPVSGGQGVQYVTDTSGSVNGGMTITAAYVQQLYLQLKAQPGNGGKVTGGGWYNTGTVVAIKATPRRGMVFTGWSGSGSGSYTGTDNPATVTVLGPITETAYFKKA